MKFHPQKLPGVFLIEPTSFIDDRGVFRRHFCEKEFADYGIATHIAQCNVSENKSIHTLRGFHYLLQSCGESKTISCLKGAIYDIVVDIREDSPTYKKWISFELNDVNRMSIHIPPGCANAFLTMDPGCLIHYYHSKVYMPNAERGIRFNDPTFEFRWPVEPKVISEKDRTYLNYHS